MNQHTRTRSDDGGGPRIALDFDGVVADFHSAVVELSDVLTFEDHFQEWGFDDGVEDHFYETAVELWEDHPETVQPVEPDTAAHVASLREHATVHIVTNTLASEETLLWWLDEHDVPHDGIVMLVDSDNTKADLGYDYYIDDNPGMAGTVDFQYLFDWPWNDSPSKFASPAVTYYEVGSDARTCASTIPVVARVNSIEDVVTDIQRKQ